MESTGRVAGEAALSVDEVASMARVSRSDVLRAIDSHALRAHQVRGEWQVLAADMRRWLSRR